MTLKENFDQAVKQSKELPSKPDNETLLKLYSLYKQATEGDAKEDTGINPFDFVAKAKYEAWKNRKGMSSDDAMNEYISTIRQLQSNQ